MTSPAYPDLPLPLEAATRRDDLRFALLLLTLVSNQAPSAVAVHDRHFGAAQRASAGRGLSRSRSRLVRPPRSC